MERLAKGGMMFTQAYASSISSPTRCSLITGTNAARHRVTNWTLFKDKTTDRESDVLTLPDWNYNGVAQVGGTNNTFVGTSFVQILKNNGYHTIHCGKAHFGAIDTPGEDPHHWGFEVNIAGHAAGGLASYLGENNYGHTKDGKPYAPNAIPGLEKYWGSDTFATEALTQEAIIRPIFPLQPDRRRSRRWTRLRNITSRFTYICHIMRSISRLIRTSVSTRNISIRG